MKTVFLKVFVIMLTLAFAGCGGSGKKPAASNTSANNSSNTSSVNSTSANNSPSGSTTLSQPEGYESRQTILASLTQAVRQYNAAERHLPAQLSDLVPTYIANIPQVPPGFVINYDVNNGSVTIVQQ